MNIKWDTVRWGNCVFGAIWLILCFRGRCRVGVLVISCHASPWCLWLRMPHVMVQRGGQWYDFTMSGPRQGVIFKGCFRRVGATPGFARVLCRLPGLDIMGHWHS